MPDESLRALERASRARPDDVAAGWAYARALERAGERRALFAELCRLDRLGDAAASAAIDAWHAPGPGLRAPRVHPAAFRDLALAATGTLEDVERTRGGRLALRFDDGSLVVVDPGESVPVSREHDVVHLGRRGDDLLHVMASRAVTRDGDVGRVINDLALETPVTRAVARGDRVLVAAESGTLASIDLASDQNAWSHPGWQQPLAAAGPTSLWGDTSMELRLFARDLGDGHELWTRNLGSLLATNPLWWRLDRDGLVVQEAVSETPVLDVGRGEAGWSARWTELDPRTGEARWSVEGEPAFAALLTSSALVLFGPTSVTALARHDGSTRWTTKGVEAQCVGAAEDVVYVVEVAVSEETSWGSLDADGRDVRKLTLSALELTTGAARFRHAVELPLEAEVRQAVLSVGPGCVDAIVVMDDRPAQVIRFTH